MLHQPVGQLGFILGQADEALHLGLGLCLVELARAVYASIRVLRLGLQTSHFNNSFHGLAHVTTLASMVPVIAVDKLLFGERDKLVA